MTGVGKSTLIPFEESFLLISSIACLLLTLSLAFIRSAIDRVLKRPVNVTGTQKFAKTGKNKFLTSQRNLSLKAENTSSLTKNDETVARLNTH